MYHFNYSSVNSHVLYILSDKFVSGLPLFTYLMKVVLRLHLPERERGRRTKHSAVGSGPALILSPPVSILSRFGAAHRCAHHVSQATGTRIGNAVRRVGSSSLNHKAAGLVQNLPTNFIQLLSFCFYYLSS